MRKLKKIKEHVQQRSADVRIGKAGITEGVINEIKRFLMEKEIVKIKILRTAAAVEGKDRFQIAEEVAKKLNAKLLEVRGRTFILYKKIKDKAKKKLKTSM